MKDDFWSGFVIGSGVTMLFWILLVSFVPSPQAVLLRTQAIEHGAARYHPTTGEFEWIDKAEGESE